MAAATSVTTTPSTAVAVSTTAAASSSTSTSGLATVAPHHVSPSAVETQEVPHFGADPALTKQVLRRVLFALHGTVHPKHIYDAVNKAGPPLPLSYEELIGRGYERGLMGIVSSGKSRDRLIRDGVRWVRDVLCGLGDPSVDALNLWCQTIVTFCVSTLLKKGRDPRNVDRVRFGIISILNWALTIAAEGDVDGGSFGHRGDAHCNGGHGDSVPFPQVASPSSSPASGASSCRPPWRLSANLAQIEGVDHTEPPPSTHDVHHLAVELQGRLFSERYRGNFWEALRKRAAKARTTGLWDKHYDSVIALHCYDVLKVLCQPTDSATDALSPSSVDTNATLMPAAVVAADSLVNDYYRRAACPSPRALYDWAAIVWEELSTPSTTPTEYPHHLSEHASATLQRVFNWAMSVVRPWDYEPLSIALYEDMSTEETPSAYNQGNAFHVAVVSLEGGELTDPVVSALLADKSVKQRDTVTGPATAKHTLRTSSAHTLQLHEVTAGAELRTSLWPQIAQNCHAVLWIASLPAPRPSGSTTPPGLAPDSSPSSTPRAELSGTPPLPAAIAALAQHAFMPHRLVLVPVIEDGREPTFDIKVALAELHRDAQAAVRAVAPDVAVCMLSDVVWLSQLPGGSAAEACERPPQEQVRTTCTTSASPSGSSEVPAASKTRRPLQPTALLLRLLFAAAAAAAERCA